MSIAALNWAWTQECPNATSKLVLLALADKANEDGECWPGMDTVARMAGVSSRQVSTHLARLEEAGLIVRKRRRSALGHLGRYVFHLCLTTGSALPVDQRKSTSGSTPPVEADRQWKPDVATTGSPASSSTGSLLPDKKHPPRSNPQVNPSSDVPSDPEVSDEARDLTRQLAMRLKANGFKVPARGRKAHREWLLAMDRLLRIDGADAAEVARVIGWATEDLFWRANIQSAPKFREKYPQLRLKMLTEAEPKTNVRPLRQDATAARFGENAR